jgi:hypothetical protein
VAEDKSSAGSQITMMKSNLTIHFSLGIVLCASIAIQALAVPTESHKVNRKPVSVAGSESKSAKSKGNPIANSASCVLPHAQLTRLEKAASAGDGEAAAALYTHYAIGMQDPGGKAIPWLYRGAQLGQITCMMNLANFIKIGLMQPEPIANSRVQAVKKLLLAASAKGDPDAHRMLAECYSDGYFGTANSALARKHSALAKQADRMRQK